MDDFRRASCDAQRCPFPQSGIHRSAALRIEPQARRHRQYPRRRAFPFRECDGALSGRDPFRNEPHAQSPRGDAESRRQVPRGQLCTNYRSVQKRGRAPDADPRGSAHARLQGRLCVRREVGEGRPDLCGDGPPHAYFRGGGIRAFRGRYGHRDRPDEHARRKQCQDQGYPQRDALRGERMSLAQTSIHRPVLMTVLALGTVLLGVRKYPNVDSPGITVRTTYSGANAAVVEAEVTEVLEESINSASGIKSLTSTSSDGSSNIKVEFEVGSDLETAANDIRDRVSRAQRNLPDAADAPVVYKSDSDSDPILIVSLLSDTRDAMEISEIARNQVKERLQTIPGVSEVTLWGEKQPVVRLWLDPVRMRSLGVTASDVSNAISAENQELPSGKIEGQTMNLSLRTLGRLTAPQEFSKIAVKTASDGTVIRLCDIADIHYEPEDTRTGFKRNGKDVIAIAVIAQPGSNHVQIANEFYKRVEEIKRDLPSDVRIVSGMDASISIRASIREVVETIFISFLLVIAVIFLFLREGRTTLIPMIVIPVSIIGSFFVLYIFGFSINVLTLLAMVLAIGLVVDDAIVIVENIYQKIEKKMTPSQAAVAGTNEIFFAVIATSVVLMAVFVPMLALGGTTGLLFREFVAVMIGTVFISTVCALTLSPMLCSKFLRSQKKGWLYNKTEPFFEWLNAFYSKLLDAFLKVRWVIFIIMAVLAVVVWFCFSHLSSEMAPMEDSGMFMVNISAPEGTSVTQVKKETEAFVSEMTALMDSSEYQEIQAGARSSGGAMIRVTLNSDRKSTRLNSS